MKKIKKEIEVTGVNKKTDKELKLELATAMFEYSEKQLEDSVDNMVKRAEDLVNDLKRERGYFNEKKNSVEKGLMSRADCFRSMIHTIQSCFNNYSFDDKMRHVSDYEKTKAVKAVLEGNDSW